MKIINGILDRVFDGHSTCIPVNQLDEIGSSHSVFQSRNVFETKPLQKKIILFPLSLSPLQFVD